MIIEGFLVVAFVFTPSPVESLGGDTNSADDNPAACAEGGCIVDYSEPEPPGEGVLWSRLSDSTWEFCEIPVYINYEGGWGRDFQADIDLVASVFDLTLPVYTTDWRGENEFDISPHEGITIQWPRSWSDEAFAGWATSDGYVGGYYIRSSIALRPGDFSHSAQSFLFFHELGHALGLGHIDDEYQMMSYNTENTWYNWGDFEGIMELTKDCLK